MTTPWSKTHKVNVEEQTIRKYRDGDNKWRKWTEQIFTADESHKCPTYVNRTPPCQGSCPSGEDIRGWLQIVRGIEKPTGDMSWQEYAFRRSTASNPFPSQMGRVCPAPCEAGCNRNEVDDFVGINAVEQYIGDTATKEGFAFDSPPLTSDKRVAIIGGGPAGMAAAYQLRLKGYASTVFDDHEELGGMMRYGIPAYRTPREHLDAEINRILAMGDIDVRLGVRVGEQISIKQLQNEFDAVLWALGCQSGRALPVEGGDAPNCVSGVKFLEAFNTGRLQVASDNVVCIGGGDTSIDVVSVARRLGRINKQNAQERPELVVHGYVAHDSIMAASRSGAKVTLTSLLPRTAMTAAEHEVHDALTEGVSIINNVMPVRINKDESGRAVSIVLAECTLEKDGRPVPVEGTEREIKADLIVSAIGQGGNLDGLNELDNGRGLIDSDAYYQVPDRPGHFVAGDIIRPHLLTTAIGQASVAANSIDLYLQGVTQSKRPKVDVHHFNLMEKLNESSLSVAEYQSSQEWGTDTADYAVHNYEDRSANEIAAADELFLGHWKQEERNKRKEQVPQGEEVLGHFGERMELLTEEEAIAEAGRCMSCGMCFECDNCVIYCPQDAVFRVKKDKRTTGRYVDTDYTKCIGCHVCADVCPSGYIDMGMGH
ncbi:glutamate synthase [Chromatiales bacterium (ex Bugula neritina AB1)]|nr:glutamate synthase [Chromatiales bacterium (ex Bugula neritina AB1)]